MNISPIRPAGITPDLQSVAKTSTPTASIGQTFEQALQSLDQSQSTSDGLLQKLSAGEDVDLHQVMIATEETDINFRVAMGIRDRLVEAYKEVMRMTV